MKLHNTLLSSLLGGNTEHLSTSKLGGPEVTKYSNPEEFVEAVRLGQREAYALARDHLGKSAEKNKHSYDLRTRSTRYQVGNWVLVL